MGRPLYFLNQRCRCALRRRQRLSLHSRAKRRATAKAAHAQRAAAIYQEITVARRASAEAPLTLLRHRYAEIAMEAPIVRRAIMLTIPAVLEPITLVGEQKQEVARWARRFSEEIGDGMTITHIQAR